MTTAQTDPRTAGWTRPPTPTEIAAMDLIDAMGMASGPDPYDEDGLMLTLRVLAQQVYNTSGVGNAWEALIVATATETTVRAAA